MALLIDLSSVALTDESEDSNFASLPTELALEIVMKLSVKEMIVFSMVNKNWYKFVQSEEFLSMFNSAALNDPSKYHILVSRNSSPNVIVLKCHPTLSLEPDLILPFGTRSGSVEIIGSCGGLVCITDFDHEYSGRDIFVVNPSLPKYIKLPESWFYSNLIQGIDSINIKLGFGCSTIQEDYKVLRIITEDRESDTKIEMYSLMNESWKRVRGTRAIEFDKHPVCVNGCLYWCLNQYILSFNLSTEDFVKIQLPTEIKPTSLFSWPVESLIKNGSIALLYRVDPNMISSDTKICILEKGLDGVKPQWKKLDYKCEQLIHLCQNIGFSTMEYNGFGKLVLDIWDICPESPVCVLAIDDKDQASDSIHFDFMYDVNGLVSVMESFILR